MGSTPSTRLGMAVWSPTALATTWSMDVPARITSGSRLIGAPDSRFMRPRCGLVEAKADWLNRPRMKTMSSRWGSIGWRTGPSSISAPRPFAHQCAGSTPFEKNTMPSRRGGPIGAWLPVAGAVAVSPNAGSDSIQGRARATPAPRRNRRRPGSVALRRWLMGCSLPSRTPPRRPRRSPQERGSRTAGWSRSARPGPRSRPRLRPPPSR